MRFPVLTSTRGPRSLFAWMLVSALVAALGVAAAVLPSSATTSNDRLPASTQSELLANPDFTQGTSGWRTNGSNEFLTILNGNSSNPIAQLNTRTTGHAVLNDQPNTVQGANQGSTYKLTAKVRTTTPDVKGALRIREVSNGQVNSSETSFTLSGTQWQTVTLEVTTVYPQSNLDVNLVAWNLPAGKNLQIESLSMTPHTQGSTPPIAPPTTPPPSSCDVAPPADTIFGASISSSGGLNAAESLADLDRRFGTVPVVRHFSTGLPFAWDSSRADLLEDRTIVMSFKAHPTEITSGQLDSFFRDWFASAPEDQIIYWSYFHEPENNINKGEFTAAQYRAAWSRLGQLADEVCKPNMFSTLILTEWTMNPSSKRDYRSYDAGPEVIDVLAFDPYNGASDPNRNYYRDPADLLGNISSKMAADGRPWGIAETGSRLVPGDAGAGRAAWLRGMADYLIAHDALFVTYFQSTSDGEWRLLDAPSINAWKSYVQR